MNENRSYVQADLEVATWIGAVASLYISADAILGEVPPFSTETPVDLRPISDVAETLERLAATLREVGK